MNERNLKRCLLSSGYLALYALGFFLLAVYFALRLHRNGRAIARAVFFGLCRPAFSLVGNRGLIKNSICYARYTPPAIHVQ